MHLKIHKSSISVQDGRKGTDLASGEKYDHVAIKSVPMIMVEDLKRVVAEEPGITVARALEIAK